MPFIFPVLITKPYFGTELTTFEINQTSLYVSRSSRCQPGVTDEARQ